MATPDNVVNVPMELLRQLAPLASGLGIDLPGVSRVAPTIDLSDDIRTLAMVLGQQLHRTELYLRTDGALVTVDEEERKVEVMTAKRFIGWVEAFVQFRVPAKSQRMRNSLSREEAEVILAQDVFRKRLRVLRGVNNMRLPVRRATGRLEWLPFGYDAESQIYTWKEVEYDMGWPLDRAVAWLNSHGEEYPWNWGEDEGKGRDMMQLRPWCVVVMAMLGVYCRGIFRPGTPKPMILCLGNKPGAGKGAIIQMILTPVFGDASTTKVPGGRDDNAMADELDTAVINRRPFLFLDDIGGGLFSNALNQFLTSSSRQGRIKGGNTEFKEAVDTQVFATGNDINLTEDLMRRTLIADMFLDQELKDRKFKKEISEEYLKRSETRQGFLAALCALVRNAIETFDSVAAAGGKMPRLRGLPSFETWTSELSTIVQLAGYNDPLIPPDLTGGGSEAVDEVREFLIAVASEAEKDTDYDREELVEKARALKMLEGLVGLPGQAMDSKMMIRFGKALQKQRGQRMTDANGRKFRFSHKRQKRGARYPLVFI